MHCNNNFNSSNIFNPEEPPSFVYYFAIIITMLTPLGPTIIALYLIITFISSLFSIILFGFVGVKFIVSFFVKNFVEFLIENNHLDKISDVEMEWLVNSWTISVIASCILSYYFIQKYR